MPRRSTLALDFQPRLDGPAGGKELRDGLSAVLQVGDTLWVANDESASVERLTLGRAGRAGGHVQFPLRELLDLPQPGTREDTPEVDVEGLDWCDGYLWVAGSHSRKRCKPDLAAGAERSASGGPANASPAATGAPAAGGGASGLAGRERKAARKRLARVEAEANRFLLARIPMAQVDGLPALLKRDGERRPARLPGDDMGNELTRLLRDDRHLGPWMDLPGKDNGFDVEGLGVDGENLFLGLRGPVLRGWAVVLQLRPRDAGGGELELARVGKRKKVRKHFLQLGGLGVRDLCVHGDDLLLLAGPTMALDGPVKVLRWRGGARCTEGAMVPASELQELIDLPCGTGCDHAEGLALFHRPGGRKPALLVVHDQPASHRQPGESTLLADVWPLG